MKKVQLKNKLIWCWKYTKKEMPLVVLGLFISFCITYLYSLEPLFTGNLMDLLSIKEFSSFIEGLFFLFLIQSIALLLTLISERLSYFVEKKSTIRGESQFFSSVIRRDNSVFLRGRESETLNILQSDFSVVLSMWISTLPQLISSVFTLLVVSWRLVSINVSAFFLTFFLSFAPFIVYRVAGGKERKLNQEGKALGDKYIECIQESIRVSYEVDGEGINFFRDFFIGRLQDNYRVSYKKLKLSQGCRGILFFINIVTVSIIYFFLGIGIFKGNNSIGDFMAAVLYSQQIRSIINKLGNSYKGLIAQTVSIDRVQHMLEKEEKSYLKFFPKRSLALCSNSMSFSYNNNEIFRDLTLDFEDVGLYILKGNNGSGKTTLLELFLGMQEPNNIQKGSIEIHGCYSSADILFIPSSPRVFPTTIRDNMLFGDECSDEVLLSNLHKVGLGDWLSNLEGGLNCIINPKNMGLSNGERMRFALASALSRNKKIYLLDEIEDGIDSRSKDLIKELVIELAQNKMIVVISHSTLFDDSAKKIVILK